MMKQSMKTRIITGAALIALLAFAIAVGGWICGILCMLAVGLAMHEMIQALRARGHQVVRWPVWLATVLSIPGFLLYDNRFLMLVVALTCMITTAYVLFHGEPHLEDILVSLMPLFAVALPGMCLLAQMNVAARWQQTMLLCSSFIIPTAGDAAAYFIGSRFGRRKLIPAVSPNKTVEGALAGLAGSEIAALCIYGITRWCAAGAALPPLWHFAILGVAGGVVGQIGDLFASLVKRHCGIKDYGSIFPGHGGMMDRLDSVLFVAVLVYLYQSMIW